MGDRGGSDGRSDTVGGGWWRGGYPSGGGGDSELASLGLPRWGALYPTHGLGRDGAWPARPILPSLARGFCFFCFLFLLLLLFLNTFFYLFIFVLYFLF